MKLFKKQYLEVVTVENLLCAWKEFLPGKRGRLDVSRFGAKLSDNIFDLARELQEKTYTHGGYEEFHISDPKPRIIHKASVRDRLLHHVLYRELYVSFDRVFIFDSYSCRMGKGTHRAIERFTAFAYKVSRNHTKTCWVLKCDIRKFFASIDHMILFDILATYIEDKDILALLHTVIESFSTAGRPGVGLPLGNLTSQLLVNIYMNEFDQYVKRNLKVTYYIRYADDFVVLSQDKQYLESLIPLFSSFLEEKMKLSLHPNKVFIKTFASGVDFLGWVHFPHHRTLRTATKRRMRRHPGIASNNEAVLNSYRGLLRHGNAHKLDIDLLKLIEKTKDGA